MLEHLRPDKFDHWVGQVQAVQRLIDERPAEVVLVNIRGVVYINRDHGHDVGSRVIDAVIGHWLTIATGVVVAYGYQTWLAATPRPLPEGDTLEARLARGHTVDLGPDGIHRVAVRTLAFRTEPGDELDWLMVEHTVQTLARAWDW